MARVRRCLLGIVAALVLCTFMVGCSKEESSTDAFDGNFVGTWVIADMNNSGGNFSESIAETLNSAEKSAQLNVMSDKTFTFDFFGTSLEGTWKAKDDKTANINLMGVEVDAMLNESGVLSLTYDGSSISFKRKE